jgi:hypothetical protein
MAPIAYERSGHVSGSRHIRAPIAQHCSHEVTGRILITQMRAFMVWRSVNEHAYHAISTCD